MPSHCAPTSALKEVVVTGVTTGEFDAPASRAMGVSRVCVSQRISETGHMPSHCAPTSATGVTTVVSLTLQRAGQWELLARQIISYAFSPKGLIN